MGTDAAENAEDGLHEQRRLDQFALKEMRKIVEVANVVAFELEAGAVVGTGAQDELDVLEGIPEHEIARAFEIGLFPVVLELLVAIKHRKQGKIHRAHVEARAPRPSK